MNHFPPEFRTASVVPRWSILWTLTKDLLSNHSFFVTLYANQIAEMIEWGMPSHRYTLLWRALTHDLDECFTGDVVAPAKKAILDDCKSQAWILKQMQERMPTIIEQTTRHQSDDQIWQEAGRIVKAADRLDALLFLTVERRMGNGVVAPRILEVMAGLHEAWELLPARPELRRVAWLSLVQEIGNHETAGGFGV